MQKGSACGDTLQFPYQFVCMMFDGSSVEVFSTLKANLLQSDATGSLSIIIQCSAYWHSSTNILEAVVRAKAMG